MTERLRLSASERDLLKSLRDSKEGEIISPPRNMEVAIYGLEAKEMVDVTADKSGIVSIRLTYKGQAYMQEYPNLRNPISKTMQWFIGLLITIIVGISSAFIGYFIK